MKARKLRVLLNDTQYSLSNHAEYIAIGSDLCHDLISVNKKTLKVRYALDTFNNGRDALKNDKLIFIWDKLHELIESGEIHDIINGKDVIENPLPVFTVECGKLVESVTDKYGWPNTDDDGVMMYENTHYPTKEQAIKYGLNEERLAAKWNKERISELEAEAEKIRLRVKEHEQNIIELQAQL